jgi:alkylation response protein AidB-like acyl-CoA dehydrogenase
LVVDLTGTWDVAVRNARAALAHQLIAASRDMLEQARRHAVDRIQFGRPIASFQAIRHKLADSLVAIEAAAAVAGACAEGCDPLLAAAAKSLAGQAAHVTATHAQQVLAGIGFTTDHAFHRSLKRTMVLDTLFGSAATLPTEIGLTLLARHGAPRLVEL